MNKELCRKIADALLAGAKLSKAKMQFSEEFSVDPPRNSDILAILTPEEKPKLLPLLRRKPIRTLSGVTVVAVMTSPAKCPHGKCITCPGGLDSPFGDTPQSYTGLEPAARRGIQHNYNPFDQTKSRLSQLEQIGHPTDKVELIIMGGTFPARETAYQLEFAKGCYDGANGFRAPSIAAAMKHNETAQRRIVGLTVETRPDYCLPQQIDLMLSYGTTRVELGVQSTVDSVLERMERGHTVRQTADAFRFLKDAGLKVVAHMMPFLPGATSDDDIDSFRRLFNDSSFQPDELKIYPTEVLKGTKLYRLWKSGKYKPPTMDETVNLIAQVKKTVPRFVRLKRVMRDIPSTVIQAGPNKTHLRQLVQSYMKKLNWRCNCIRCREVGLNAYKRGIKPDWDSVKLNKLELKTAGGREFFLTFDETKHDLLVALLRLRLPESPWRPELQQAAIVRELHVYGASLKLGALSTGASGQHRGYGKKLLAGAESLAAEAGFSKLAVTSGVGAREYYRKFGYSLNGAYMVKSLAKL